MLLYTSLSTYVAYSQRQTSNLNLLVFYHLIAGSRYAWFLASLSVKLNNSESSEYIKSYYHLDANVSLL